MNYNGKRISINKIEVFLKSTDKVIIYDRENRQSFIIDSETWTVMCEIKVCESVAEIAEKNNYSVENVCNIIEELNAAGVLNINDTSGNNRFVRTIIYPDQILNSEKLIVRLVYFLLTKLSVPIFIAGIILLSLNYEKLRFENVFKISSMIIIISELAMSIILHEFGHAIVGKINGANIAEIGISIKLFFPSVYTRICGISFITNKLKRIQIFMGGIMQNMVIVGISCIIISLIKVVEYFQIYISFLIIINIVLIIVNSFPIKGNDGYKIRNEITRKSEKVTSL